MSMCMRFTYRSIFLNERAEGRVIKKSLVSWQLQKPLFLSREKLPVQNQTSCYTNAAAINMNAQVVWVGWS